MDGQCRATKANGERCRGTATSPAGLCWAHDPVNAEQRQRIASRAGRSKPNRELADVKARLQSMIDDVRDGTKLYNTLIRAVSVELKIREVEELEQRIQALEAAS